MTPSLRHMWNSVENATRAESRVRGSAWGRGHGCSNKCLHTTIKDVLAMPGVNTGRFSYQVMTCHTFSNFNNPVTITNPMCR